MCDNELLTRTCRPIPAGSAPLAGHDLEHLLGHAIGWQIVDGSLTKSFEFGDHYQTMAFANAVAWISHREDHHPVMTIEYKTCTIGYRTHSIDALSENDFICAAKVDALVED